MSLFGGAAVIGFVGDTQTFKTFRGTLNGGWRYFAVTVFLTVFAGALNAAHITTLLGGYLFSFALLGFWWPARLIEAFVFCVAFGHRDFTYLAMSFGGPAGDANLFITEWVLAILLVSGLPGLFRLLRKLDRGVLLVLAYFAIGAALFAMTVSYWPPVRALRDFALVYYSLFAVVTMVHLKGHYAARRVGIALILGTIPNLVGEVGNYLYGTLPLTPDQENASLRNSFYYTVSLGILLPYVAAKNGRLNAFAAVYCTAIYMVVLLYSYSKTAMIAAMALTVIFFLPRINHMRGSVLVVVMVLFSLPMVLTPRAKIHHFTSIFSETTYTQNARLVLQRVSMRDYSEHPYGIGFGAPIFGEHSRKIIKNLNAFHAIHNSYLSILRRMGLEGLMVFGVLVSMAFYYAVRCYLRFAEEDWRKNPTLAVILSGVVCMIFPYAHVALEGPFMGALFWCVIGCMFVVGQRDQLKEAAFFEPVHLPGGE